MSHDRIRFLTARLRSWLLVAGVPALHAEPRLAAYALAGGLTLLVCGIGDHRLIVDTLVDRQELCGGTHPRTF